MSVGSARDYDPEFEEIVSPLANNAKLRELTAAFATRQGKLEDNGVYGSEASEHHFNEVERLADYLGHRDYVGGFDQWDWTAMFVSDEKFRISIRRTGTGCSTTSLRTT